MKHSEIQVSQNSSGPELYFSTLREEEKLLCSLQLVYAAPFDSYLAGWLVNKLSREDVISNGLSRQSLEVTLTQMVERGLMVPARTGCELNQRFIDQAFAWPLQNNKHRQIIDAVRQLVTASEFSGQSRYTSESERSLIASYYLGNPDFEERPRLQLSRRGARGGLHTHYPTGFSVRGTAFFAAARSLAGSHSCRSACAEPTDFRRCFQRF